MRNLSVILVASFLYLFIGCSESGGYYEVTRLNNSEPIITQSLFENVGVAIEGNNINGPSVIRIPDWIKSVDRADPTAKYYMYFAHHKGQYIRMAWAATIEGPWQLYHTGSDIKIGDRGVLDNGKRDINLDNGIVIQNNHLASPDAHVDHDNKRIILYFHTGSSTYVDSVRLKKQFTYVSTSKTGLSFYDDTQSVILGNSYFRVFKYSGKLYALDNGATPNQALDAENPWSAPAGYNYSKSLWKKHPKNPFQHDITEFLGELRVGLRVRHSSVRIVNDEMHVFYSRVGDSVERILMSTIDLNVGDWSNWDASYPPAEILKAIPGWEGGELAVIHSKSGAAPENVNQLRDPFVFEDTDGSIYLFYTGRGEDAIGIAKLTYHN